MPTILTDGQQTAIVPDMIPIPKAKYAPEPDAVPSHVRKIENFAENEDTARETLKWCQAYLNKFKDQGQRTAFETEMDIADELYRAAANRSSLDSDQSANTEKTTSKVQLAAFYCDLRAITANENIVVLGNEQLLPVKYEPIPGCPDYGSSDQAEAEGERLARYHNALLAYVWEVSHMDKCVADCLWRLNKYGNVVIEMVWDYRVEERMIKKPKFGRKMLGLVEDRDNVVGFTWKRTDVTMADYPRLVIYDMKDVWFDAMIDDVQQQSCMVFRFQKQLSEVWGMQKTGQFTNVGDITNDNFYQGEQFNSIKTDRGANAGESSDAETPTTLVDLWKFWVRLPVNPDTGKWEPDKQLCQWYRVHFAGYIDGSPVCLEIRQNPHTSGEIPVEIAHALKDDKGAFHLSYCTLGKSYYAQEMSLFDMANDNVRERNRVPLLVEKGSLDIRTLTFAPGGNRIWVYKTGSKEPTELKIQDTTQTTIPMLAATEERRQKILGTNKAFLGEPIGGRQSASGYLGTLDQALKPAIEDCKYKAEQILPFIAYWVKQMYYDFGNPETTLIITYENEQLEVKPSHLYGDFRIRVASIKNFQDSALAKKQDNELLGQVLPVMVQIGAIDQNGAKVIGKQMFARRNIEHINEIFNTVGDYDAQRVARSENMAVLWQGVRDLPRAEENHAVHIKEHESYLATVVLLPEGSQPDEGSIKNMQMHIQMHKNFGEQSKRGSAPNQASLNQPAPATTPGEVSGDMISGEMGNMANLESMPTPDEGRPPMYQGGQ